MNFNVFTRVGLGGSATSKHCRWFECNIDTEKRRIMIRRLKKREESNKLAKSSLYTLLFNTTQESLRC